MKKKIIITGLALSLFATPALANCPSGVCEVEINCTTGVVTYKDAAPRVIVVEPVVVQPVAPTHSVVIQTANSSFGTSGSYEQVQQAVQQIITAPQAPQEDPCSLGGCTKVIVNATTKTTEILPLSPADIQQRLVDRYMNYARQLEMAIAARDVVIQPIVETTAPTVDETTSMIQIDSTPVVYVTADKSGKVNVVKKKPKALVRKKGMK